MPRMIQLPDTAALLLDLDGTLIDLAATPDSVIVPQDLPATLIALRDRLGGALAIVTGRPIEAVDHLLPNVATAVAGEHGGVIRYTPGGLLERAPSQPVPQAWLDHADRMSAAFPGSLVERKARGYVLHYRQAPEAGPVFEEALKATLDGWPHHRLIRAHMAWEIKPVGIDKGTAVAALMQRAPFAGRMPIFIGDDVTDEDGMREAVTRGGLGLRVAESFGTAGGVRNWVREQGRP
jgi:trehalose 6-phosphate phosphatase